MGPRYLFPYCVNDLLKMCRKVQGNDADEMLMICSKDLAMEHAPGVYYSQVGCTVNNQVVSDNTFKSYLTPFALQLSYYYIPPIFWGAIAAVPIALYSV